jgi:hypothetical protein
MYGINFEESRAMFLTRLIIKLLGLILCDLSELSPTQYNHRALLNHILSLFTLI